MRRVTRVLLLLALGMPGSATAAFDLCVSNDNDFAGALTSAKLFPVNVKLVQGTYHIDATSWFLFGGNDVDVPVGGTSLRGGYTANCASRNIGANNTIITEGVPPNANVIGTSIELSGNLTFEGVTLVLPHGLYLYAGNSADIAADTQVLFRRSVIRGTGTSTAETYSPVDLYWNQSNDIGGSLRVVDSLVYGNGGGCVFNVFVPGGSPQLEFINDTIVDNNRGVCLDDHNGDGHGGITAYNSIFYGNGGADLTSDNAASLLSHDVIGNGNYPTPIIPPAAMSSADPKLNASHRPIESPPSPVINSGTNSAPGGLPASDLDGGPRIVGNTVDRGAYESTVDDSFILTVTNTANSGAGSLRAAIANANANGGGLITFDIGSGCGPQTITLTSALPDITAPTLINGYTQTGSTQNSLDIGDDAGLCVILEAGNSGVTTGLRIDPSAGDGVALSLRGMAFSGFSDAAVDLMSGSHHGVSGSRFGGNVGGVALSPNGIDIRLAPSTHDVIIGGNDPAQRNILGDANGDAVQLQGGALLGSHDNQILGNLVGLGWNTSNGSYTARGNGGSGIHVLGHDNTVSGNVIGNNGVHGVSLDGPGAFGNVVDENLIGTDELGGSPGNTSMGIAVLDTAHDNTLRDNSIAHSGQKGIRVVSGAHNKIRRNAIFANALLGIDLAGEGVTANDDDSALQPNGYANRGQNYPVLSAASGSAHAARISGTLTTTAGDYTVDFFSAANCDALGFGEGRNWLHANTVTVAVPQGSGQGTTAFTLNFSVGAIQLHDGDVITATATDAAGDTSEFSACQTLTIDDLFADGFE